MKNHQTIKLILVMSFLALTTILLANAQILDQIFNGNRDVGEGEQREPGRLRSVLRNMMAVNVPMVYDMTRNGSSLGINVLSGLVKVERGEEAERNGLRGPRPLSVRIFGMPIYERGSRVRSPQQPPISVPDNKEGEPKVEESVDDEELPIIP